jgi:hypothetical protein
VAVAARARTVDIPIGRALDQLTTRTRTLRAAADPDRPSTYLDNLSRLELTRVQGLLEAIGTWQQWAEGHRVSPDALTAAVETITEASRDGRLLPTRLDDLMSGRHEELLPSTVRRDQGIQRSRRVELGLEL